jgi:hypothetical protein
MPTFTRHTISIGGKHHIVEESRVDDFKPEAITKYEFTYRTVTVDDEIEASRVVVALGLIGPTGAKEPASVWKAKGRTYALRTITAWNVPGPADTILSINAENIALIPSDVLHDFGAECELGFEDGEALAAAKK